MFKTKDNSNKTMKCMKTIGNDKELVPCETLISVETFSNAELNMSSFCLTLWKTNL